MLFVCSNEKSNIPGILMIGISSNDVASTPKLTDPFDYRGVHENVFD
jgi:hypothetical protein